MVASLPIKVRCLAEAGICSVTGTLSGRSGSGIGAMLGSVDRELPAGESWSVVIPLSEYGREVVRKDGKASALALFAVQDPDGKVRTATRHVTLKRPARRER